eukprot:1153391-Pelagomonas_calceolata.AAC.5
MPLEARAKIVSPLCPPSQQSGSTICALQDLTWAAKGAALQLRWRGVQGMDIKEGSRITRRAGCGGHASLFLPHLLGSCGGCRAHQRWNHHKSLAGGLVRTAAAVAAAAAAAAAGNAAAVQGCMPQVLAAQAGHPTAPTAAAAAALAAAAHSQGPPDTLLWPQGRAGLPGLLAGQMRGKAWVGWVGRRGKGGNLLLGCAVAGAGLLPLHAAPAGAADKLLGVRNQAWGCSGLRRRRRRAAVAAAGQQAAAARNAAAAAGGAAALAACHVQQAAPDSSLH